LVAASRMSQQAVLGRFESLEDADLLRVSVAHLERSRVDTIDEAEKAVGAARDVKAVFNARPDDFTGRRRLTQLRIHGSPLAGCRLGGHSELRLPESNRGCSAETCSSTWVDESKPLRMD